MREQRACGCCRRRPRASPRGPPRPSGRRLSTSCRPSIALADALSFRPGRLGREGRCPNRDFQAAAGRREAVEGRRQKLVQHRLEGDCGSFASASRSASVRWAVSSVTSRSGSGLIASSSSSSGSAGAPPMVMTARCTDSMAVVARRSSIASRFAVSDRRRGRLVLGPDEAALDRQPPSASMLTNTPARAISAGS